jgi:predicted kinase
VNAVSADVSEEQDRMASAGELAPPTLIVVAGRAGSGKTTLAHALARAVRCPIISRDEIKEGFVNATGEVGEPGDAVQRHVSDAFFDVVKLLLERRVTLVAEAAFQHAVWAPRLQPLSGIARVRIVLCDVDPELARSRHIERGLADPARERFHDDRGVGIARAGGDWRALPIGGWDPPHLDVPTLAVDTSDGYRPHFEAIVAFARS